MKLLKTDNSFSTLAIRTMVGVVFLNEGILKFYSPHRFGPLRFYELGFPEPDFLAYLSGSFEIWGGFFLIIGLFTRLASAQLFFIILVAIDFTIIPNIGKLGFFELFHNSSLQWCMLVGNAYIMRNGGGRYSCDRTLSIKFESPEVPC